jgi:hypothetical protein
MGDTPIPETSVTVSDRRDHKHRTRVARSRSSSCSNRVAAFSGADRPSAIESVADEYLGLLAEALVVLSDNYLPAVNRRFKAAAIWEALQPDFQRLTEVTDAFLRVRQRVAACTKTNLRVMTPVAGIRPAGIFPHDLLHEPRWNGWATDVRSSLAGANRLGRATA